MKLPAISLTVTAVLWGCSSFLHLSPSAMPEVAALCAIGGDVRPELDAIANEYGVPVAFVDLAFTEACSGTKDPKSAKTVGLSSARASAKAAHKMGAKFEAKP